MCALTILDWRRFRMQHQSDVTSSRQHFYPGRAGIPMVGRTGWRWKIGNKGFGLYTIKDLGCITELLIQLWNRSCIWCFVTKLWTEVFWQSCIQKFCDKVLNGSFLTTLLRKFSENAVTEDFWKRWYRFHWHRYCRDTQGLLPTLELISEPHWVSDRV